METAESGEKGIYMESITLAYMGKLLMKETTLDLKHGHCYGLIGQNGAGKTTTMRRMAAGDIADYPLDIKTVYVQNEPTESDMVAALAELTVKEFVPRAQRQTLEYEKGKLDGLLLKKDADHRAVRKRLAEVETGLAELDTPAGPARASQILEELGFNAGMQAARISTLSGGWRMRLALAHSVFHQADILLLDEPTNHLALDAIAWLTDYVRSLRGKSTVIIVSHNRKFLDDVVTDIMHLHDLRLTYYEGGIANFEEKVQDMGDDVNSKWVMSWHDKVKAKAKSAEEEVMTFTFPKPGRLYGVSRLSQPVMKMEGMNFTYPGTERQILYDIKCRLTMTSRVALVGGNGAGKSTLMKLLVGDMVPNNEESGEVWKHPNLRVAYVAQHSGDHLVKYIGKSPVAYILERFRGGQDQEIAEKDSIKLTEEEAAEAKGDGKVEDIRDRRFIAGRSEFLVKWQGLHEKHCTWMKEADLERMGEPLKKMMKKFNECRAADNAELRQLTRSEVRRHLADFGIDGDIAEGNLERMSGGQKSRLTLAAAMWMCPHVLVLDEPTNYLDIESLFALRQATEKFPGGVIVVSHDREFSAAFCKTLWVLQEGRLQTFSDKEFDGALERYQRGEF